MPSPVDQGLQAVFDELKAAGANLPDPAVVGVEEGRAARARYYAYLNQPDGELPVDAVRDVTIEGPHGPFRLRLYFPTSERPAPVTVFIHGGGWWTGDVPAYDQICRRLAVESGCAVASVEYRLWPEHRFPVPVDETMAVAEWVLNQGVEHGLDPSRIGFCGDSAGATLALHAGVQLKHTGAVRALALVYGVYLMDVDTPSWREIGDGTYGLTVAQMQWIWDGYLHGQDADPTDPRIAPAHADLTGLSYTWVMVGDLDPLIDDSRALAANLAAAGVPHHLKVEEGMTHFIWMWQRLYQRSRASIAEAGAVLKRELRRD
ncbi:MAG: alpha/beta hydrolase [Proteobacteria bacterium]|nr:alpha/beta hydrolase [Pseudomonadota bacterium]